MPDIQQARKNKFSYSKLSTYESCPWRYKLQYVDHHFIDSPSIATDFGTLLHFVEEMIAKDIIANDNEPTFLIDMDKYIDIFINAGQENHSIPDILGVRKIKEKYPEEFETKDKYGYSYDDKANNYLNFGIYRLGDFLNANRHLQLLGTEIPFSVDYGNFTFHGFIDRAFIDKNSGNIIIEDIKTWQDIKGHDLVTPLQFMIYAQAIQDIYKVTEDSITCFYDLPLAQEKYQAGTKGFMKRGAKKINKILEAIDLEIYTPKPSPLCHWCVFSDTLPNQPEAGKNLCPYRSNWTKESKNFSVDFEWMGIENHEAILQAYITANKSKYCDYSIDQLPVIKLSNDASTRIRIARRL